MRDAFLAFDADASQSVAILTGRGGTFCAGYDLKVAARPTADAPLFDAEAPGPMGPTRHLLSKPVIAAVEGYAVAGGLELALWCDMRVASESAKFGVFCRRWGVPLVDGGTVRLPRLIGHSRALDMILTGREVGAQEAFDWGSPTGWCRKARRWPRRSRWPSSSRGFRRPACARTAGRPTSSGASMSPRRWSTKPNAALPALQAEARSGAARFADGKGRGGNFGNI